MRVRLKPLFILFKRNFYAHKYLCTHRERQRGKARWREREKERQSERDIHEIYVDIKIKLKHSKSARENFPTACHRFCCGLF